MFQFSKSAYRVNPGCCGCPKVVEVEGSENPVEPPSPGAAVLVVIPPPKLSGATVAAAAGVVPKLKPEVLAVVAPKAGADCGC